MHRNYILPDFPSWISKLKMGDYPLSILNAQYGSIGFINQTMARYRIHDKSYYSSNKTIDNYKSTITMYETIINHISSKYSNIIKKMITKYHQLIINEYLNEDKINMAKNHLQNSKGINKLSATFINYNFFLTLLLIYFPGLNKLRLLTKKI